MQQHYQILNLHNIIKTQDQKIQDLRHELKVANERQEQRYGQLSKQNVLQQNEKDKLIEYLKGELEKVRVQRRQQKIEQLQKSQFIREKQEREIVGHKKKCIELEGKVKRLENESELKIRELLELNKSLSQNIQTSEQNKALIMLEVSKLNYFYKNSMFDISKRKQTLLWVQKFTQYLEHAEKQEDKVLIDVNKYVKSQIQTLRTQFSFIIKELNRNQEDTSNIKGKLLKQIKGMVEENKKETEEALKQNESFWVRVLREEKQQQRNQEINKLKDELKREKSISEKEIEKLRMQKKSWENENKVLMMGFQELKTLNENRENSYKQEIKYLKETIGELIQTGELRDKEFESEIKNLTSQIQSISERYYQNVQSPISKVNEKFYSQIAKAKLQISKIHENSILKSSFEKLCQQMWKYVQKSESEAVNTEICDVIKENQAMIEEIKKKMSSNRLGRKKEPDVDEDLKFIELREKYNKVQYEVILTKKHLQKLQQYTTNMEKKSSKSDKNYSQRRLIQLESQNQALKEELELSKESHLEDMHNLKNKLYLKVIEDENTSTNHLTNSFILKLQQTNDILINYLDENERHYGEMKKSLNIINGLLVKPLETFQLLLKEITEIGLSSRLQYSRKEDQASNSQTFRTIKPEEIKVYKEILVKRGQNWQSTQKLMMELMKTLRENQKLAKKQKEREKEEEKREGEEIVRRKDRGLQKKVKDIQSQRIKDRQEFVNKLQKVQKLVQNVESKYQKVPSLQANLQKFIVEIQKRISDIVDKTHWKIDKSSIRQIKQEVIKDLRSKISEANIENQGLRKELSVLQSLNVKQ